MLNTYSFKNIIKNLSLSKHSIYRRKVKRKRGLEIQLTENVFTIVIQFKLNLELNPQGHLFFYESFVGLFRLWVVVTYPLSSNLSASGQLSMTRLVHELVLLLLLLLLSLFPLWS